jgi:uncharacterized delta-60 repeat protein
VRSSRWLKIALAGAWTLLLGSPAEADPGALDRDFGDRGKVVTDVGGSDSVRAVAVGARIVATGSTALGAPSSSDVALAVYDAAGSLDTTFDGDGLIVTDVGSDFDAGVDVLITESREYLVLARGARDNDVPQSFLLLYGSTGALDPGFGDGGIVTVTNLFARAIAVQPDGKILVAGEPVRRPAFVVRRFLADGQPDPAFGGGDGKVVTRFGLLQPHAVDIFASSGKVTVAGWSYFPGGGSTRAKPTIARYRASGALDPRFGTHGKVIGEASTAFPVAAGLQSSGEIVVASSFAQGSNFCAPADYADVLLRFDRRGNEDAMFGRRGRGRVNFIVSALAIDADDRIVVAGKGCRRGTFTFAVSRFTISGDVDRRFGRDGTTLSGFGVEAGAGATAVTARPQNRILAGGSTIMPDFLEGDFALAKYLA